MTREDTEKAYRLCTAETALEYAGEHIGGEAWQYFAESGDYAEALSKMEAASKYTRGRLSAPAVKALYGDTITLSASRMDKAKACHFAYFMRYGLRAKERDTAGFDAPQIGTFLHDVMEHTLAGRRTRAVSRNWTNRRSTSWCAARSTNTSTIICPTLRKRPRVSAICSAACARLPSVSWTKLPTS